MKTQILIKKIITIFTLMISLVGFSQNNESEIDSIFKVTLNSIKENNYYLVYSSVREYPELTDDTVNLKWKKVWSQDDYWVDCENIELRQGDTLVSNKKNDVFNGEWFFKRNGLTIKGNFINGLLNGNWDKIEEEKNETIHTHKEFILGIPNGEWYEEINGKKMYSHFFKSGKPNGLWTTFLRKESSAYYLFDKVEINYINGTRNGLTIYSKGNVVKCRFNYLNGVMNGEFIAHGDFLRCFEEKFELILNGEFSNGRLVNNLEVFKFDKATKKTYLWRKLEISPIIRYSEYSSNGKIKILFEFESIKEYKILLREIYGRLNFSNEIINCNQVNGIPCNCKKLTYDEQGKVIKVEYFGTEDYIKENSNN